MNLCHHHDAGAVPAIVRPLTFAERKAVIGALLGTTAEAPGKLLQQIHDAGHWIACDCLGDRPPPVLHTRKSHTGTYALVRMPGRPAHAPGCPVADGLSDLYEDTITPQLTQQLFEVASASRAFRAWHAVQPTPPPTIWTLVSGMARYATACSAPTGEVVTHPSRLPGLAVRMRQAATDTGTPQVASALIATRSIDRGSITPLAKDAEPIHVRGPIVDLAPNATPSGTYLSMLRVAKGTDGRYEPVAAVVATVIKASNAVGLSAASVEAAQLAFAIGRALQSNHHLQVSIDVHHPKGLDAPGELLVHPQAGQPLHVSIGRPAAPSGLYLLLAHERREATAGDAPYPDQIAGYIADRIKRPRERRSKLDDSPATPVQG